VPCRGLSDARKVVCVPEDAGEGSRKLFVAGPYAGAALKGLWRSGRLLLTGGPELEAVLGKTQRTEF